MVKIVNELTEQEKKAKEKIKKLEDIGKEMFGTNLKNLWDLLYVINLGETENVAIYIYPFVNVIKIRDPENYGNALKLANEYEKQTGEEWTLRTAYF